MELDAARSTVEVLAKEQVFPDGLPAVPDESIPPRNTWTVQPVVYGAVTFGDLCNARQTLSFVKIARVIDEIGQELLGSGISTDYAAALCAYASSVMVRKFRRATRGVLLLPHKTGTVQTTDLFRHEGSITFSYDYFEAGVDEGAGTWDSLSGDTLTVLRQQAERCLGIAASITWGTATQLSLRDSSTDAVVTDPPYDSMIEYLDASDLFYVWMKRALGRLVPELLFAADPHGLQDKELEIIVRKDGGNYPGEHRNREHYDKNITLAFSEASRVVKDEGVVTIVFGHGEPEVWHRLLGRSLRLALS